MRIGSKTRVLLVYKLIKSSGSRGITVKEIQYELSDYGIFCDRRSIYNDFDALMDTGEPFYKKGSKGEEFTFYYLNGLDPRYDKAPWEEQEHEYQSEVC
jgi:hypothetical protein